MPIFSAILKSSGKTISDASSLSSINTPSTPFGADSELAINVFTGFKAMTLNTSLSSSKESSMRVTDTLLLVSPGAKVIVSLRT